MARLQIAVVLFLVTVEVAVSFALKSSFTPSFSSSSTSLLAAAIRDVKFDVPGGTVSYDLFTNTENDEHPIVYLPGLIREKNDAQSINLQSLCKKTGSTFLRADYYGVGRSSGKFEDGTVSRWTEDTICLIDAVLKGSRKVILVGHGVGAWVAFLIAQKRPELVGGIVGLSADADFTEELLWKSLDEETKQKIMNDGIYEINWGKTTYPITKNLIVDGRKNLLLAGGKKSIKISCPIRLVHALYDEEVPFSLAIKLLESCASEDANLVVMKDATHKMDGDAEFKTMRSMIGEVMSAFKGDFDLRSPGSG